MKFVVLMTEDDHYAKWDAADDELKQRVVADFHAFDAAVAARGEVLGGEALAAPDQARTVQPAPEGERAVTDGPFAETVEQLGGFYLVELPDLETAVEVARLLPREYTIEVRPVVGIDV
ncbi:YciI family protein [Nocardioides zeae]|uniref:YciI family protein n=1 Tax=Nocardioides imazamoxiresistens TaxID=3231893 RepID=A0ABU3PY80_9ACTN|nr:YciI family protein [Nocardioides zeae]MDT9594193.1 YciI family protein [Nocardioides zeae]